MKNTMITVAGLLAAALAPNMLLAAESQTSTFSLVSGEKGYAGDTGIYDASGKGCPLFVRAEGNTNCSYFLFDLGDWTSEGKVIENIKLNFSIMTGDGVIDGNWLTMVSSGLTGDIATDKDNMKYSIEADPSAFAKAEGTSTGKVDNAETIEFNLVLDNASQSLSNYLGFVWTTDSAAVSISFCDQVYFINLMGTDMHVATYTAPQMAITWSEAPVASPSIPEPSFFGLLAGMGALALVSSRRRRK